MVSHGYARQLLVWSETAVGCDGLIAWACCVVSDGCWFFEVRLKQHQVQYAKAIFVWQLLAIDHSQRA